MNLNDFNTYLSAYWNFDESSGVRSDFINNIPLYQNGNVSSNIGKRNNSANFDGTSYLNAYDGWYFGNENGFLYSLWVFFDNTDANIILDKGNYIKLSTNSVQNSKKWVLTINNTIIPNSFSTISSNTWYHVTIGASNGIYFFSINNGTIQSTTSTYTGTLTTNTNDLLIGMSLRGRIDEMAIWSNPNITSINQFLEISNEIYQGGKCLIYNNFKQLWELKVEVNSLISYPPLSSNPNIAITKSLSNVAIYNYYNNTTIEVNNASIDKSTTNTIDSSSFSIGVLAPGQTSKTFIFRLSLANALTVKNIKIALTDTGGIPFTTSTFGIESRNYKDDFLVPENYFQGISDGSVNSPYNIAIPNIGNTLSNYVYFNVKIPLDFTFVSKNIKLNWIFDYA